MLAATLCLVAASPAAAAPTSAAVSTFVTSIDEMMVALAPQNLQASKSIRQVYAPQLDLLMLEEFADLEGALQSGRLAPLPMDPTRFNFAPRLEGPSPIGEKDLKHQHSYIAARPATLGLLLEVASRVKSGPLEISSLVRHGEYQELLQTTNVNANTAVPMHTMGLAFDIALANTRLKTIREIRDVLTRMRDAGDLLFIGERRQIVFHVVPHPSRLAHFTDVYNRAVGVASQVHGAHVIAAAPALRTKGNGKTPHVKTEVIAILPTDEFANEWWVGEAHDHEAAESPLPVQPAAADDVRPAGVLSARLLMVFGGFVATLFGLRRQQSHQLRGQRRTQIFDPADARRVAVEARHVVADPDSGEPHRRT